MIWDSEHEKKKLYTQCTVTHMEMVQRTCLSRADVIKKNKFFFMLFFSEIYAT